MMRNLQIGLRTATTELTIDICRLSCVHSARRYGRGRSVNYSSTGLRKNSTRGAPRIA